jgi:glycosyltransferase involved in cell wall biosynthesis
VTILHVAAGNAYGGIERMLVTLAEARHPRLSQQFVVSFGGRFERELRAAGTAVHRLPSPRAARPLRIWRARRAFGSVVESTVPDAVIFHGAWTHAIFAPVARARAVRVGFWQHMPITRPAWPDRWARRVQPDFAVFNSAFTRERAAFAGVPGAVIHCAVADPPPIDDSTRRRLRAELGADERHVVVLMAARLEKWKGHDVLVEALRRLPSDAAVRVWIAGGAQKAGERPFHKRLQALVAEPDLAGTVVFLGERDDVPSLMGLADVYCQPNLRGEPFGMAIAEAMRAGLPCVVSAAGGASELADDTCALMTTPGDARAVADALQRLSTNPSLRATMGRAAAVRAARLTDPLKRLDDLAALVAARAA